MNDGSDTWVTEGPLFSVFWTRTWTCCIFWHPGLNGPSALCTSVDFSCIPPAGGDVQSSWSSGNRGHWRRPCVPAWRCCAISMKLMDTNKQGGLTGSIRSGVLYLLVLRVEVRGEVLYRSHSHYAVWDACSGLGQAGQELSWSHTKQWEWIKCSVIFNMMTL